MERKLFIITGIMLLSAATLFSGSWKLEYKKHGIEVYTRKIAGSSFKEYKGVGIIESPVWTIAALMDDLEAYPQWNGNCIHAEVVVPRKGDTMIQYFVNSAPWPVKGRDVLLKTVQSVNLSAMAPDKNRGIVITIDINSITDNSLKPINDEYIRIEELKGKWIIEGIEGGKTRLTYTIRTDIGGTIPDSIGNMVSKSIPYDTIRSIRKMVTREKYIAKGKEYMQELD